MESEACFTAHQHAPLCSGKKPMATIDRLPKRQVTFSKRRTALLKKAYELSVLCDAQLAVIIFSSTGRLSEFASPNMFEILERYQESIGRTHAHGHMIHNLEYWRHEALLLKKQIDYLQMQQSFLMGENLTSLHLKDLEILESKLQVAINNLKERKMQNLQIQAQETLTKENSLLNENSMLRHKIADLESRLQKFTSSTSMMGENFVETTPSISAKHECVRDFGVSLHLGLERSESM